MQEGDNDNNRVVYIPYNSMDVLKDNHYLDGIWLDSAGLDHDKLDKTIRETLATAHNFKPDDQRAVFVFDAQKQLSQFGIITMALKVLLAFIGTVTLGIGGVGLMNIMLVSVTQRTREIGVEKALGARRHDISVSVSGRSHGHYGGRRISRDSVCLMLCRSSLGRITFYSAMAKHAEAARHPADCFADDSGCGDVDSGGRGRDQRDGSGYARGESGSRSKPCATNRSGLYLNLHVRRHSLSAAAACRRATRLWRGSESVSRSAAALAKIRLRPRFPLVINIHGGFWRARYNLDHTGHLCAALTAKGVATANLEYRRVGNDGGGWPDTFSDIRSAYQFSYAERAQRTVLIRNESW